MLRKLYTYVIALCLLLPAGAQAQELSNNAQVWLVTCSPGEELYERFGHTALWIEDEENDIHAIFNYGTFDFNTKHFYWKFMRGETWYALEWEVPYWFFRAYEAENRKIYRQELLLSQWEREELYQALMTNLQPENRLYLYNFVFDNCATRPYRLIEQVCHDSICSDYTGYTGRSFRSFIRHYVGRYSWANAGINLLFGPKADKPMSSEQRLFLPEELMYYMEQAYLSEHHTPLICDSRIAPFEIQPTPWYASWPFGLALYFLFVLAMSIYDRRRGKRSKWVEIIAAVPYILLLLVVAFLTFFSCHPLVGFGWRLLIIPATHLCARLVYIIR